MTNVARVFRLLNGPCSDLLRDVLRHYISEESFSEILQRDQLIVKACLNESQRRILYPSAGTFTGRFDDLDISVLCLMLRYISGIAPHAKGWGNIPDPADRSVSANIERIWFIQYNHLLWTQSSLSDSDFSVVWHYLYHVASELVKDLGLTSNIISVLERLVDEPEKNHPAEEKYCAEKLHIKNVITKSTAHTSVTRRHKSKDTKQIVRYSAQRKQYLRNVDEKLAFYVENIEDVDKRTDLKLKMDELRFRSWEPNMPSADDNIACHWKRISSTSKCIFDSMDYINCEGLTSHKTFVGKKWTCQSPSSIICENSIENLISETNYELYKMKLKTKYYSSCSQHSRRLQIALKIKREKEKKIPNEPAKYQSILRMLYVKNHAIPIFHLLKKGYEMFSSVSYCPVSKQAVDITLLCLQKRIKEKENGGIVIVKTDLCQKTGSIVVLVYFKGKFPGSTSRMNGLQVIWRENGLNSDEAKKIIDFENLKNGSDLTMNTLPSLSMEEAQDLFNRHSNLTMISASRYKSVGYMHGRHFVAKHVCVTLFCKCKGLIPFGESMFPSKIKSYDVDVLEGYCCFGSDAVQIGREIGAEGQCKTGTIGGFVTLENNEIGLITCAHTLYSFEDLINKNLCLDINVYTRSKTNSSGSIVKAVFRHSDPRHTSVDAALIRIDQHQSISSSFPDIDLQQLSIAGFEEQPCFYSGETLPSTHIRDQRVVKYGQVSKFTCGKITLDRLHVRIETDGMSILPTYEKWLSRTPNIPESVIMYGQYSVDSMCLYVSIDFVLVPGLSVSIAPLVPFLGYTCSNNLFFMPGDSGAFVFVVEENRNPRKQTLKCIGMAIGIEKGTHKCIITPIKSVLDSLRLESETDLKLKSFTVNAQNNQTSSTN